MSSFKNIFKKKSVVLSILVSFWFFYVAVSLGQYFVNSAKVYETYLEKRKKVIDYQFDLAQHFLLNSKPEALLSRLEEARQVGQFDKYALFENRELLGYYNSGAGPESLLRLSDLKANQFIAGDGIILKALQVGPYHLTLGIFHSLSQFLWVELKAVTLSLLFDMMIVTGLVFGIVYLFLKDILQLSKVLRSSQREDLKNIRALSQEADVLLQAATGYESSSQNLKKDNLMLASSLAPAIRHEIQIRKEPPYQIRCTVGRIDLNGYTQLMLKNKPQELFPILNDYFKRSRDIIERFQGGLIYQYVGDEVVFIFKEDDSLTESTTFERATGAVRALFQMAEELTSESLPNGMTLKASLASGELSFVKLDQGFSFSGMPLIETVRMLGQIHDRNQSSLVVYEKEFLKIKLWVPEAFERKTIFKGFMEPSEIVELKVFHAIESVADKIEPTRLAECFRSDSDLKFIIRKLSELYRGQDEASFLKIAGSLRIMSLDFALEPIIEQYLELLSDMIKGGEADKEKSKYLSMLISLAPSFLPVNLKNKKFQDLIAKASTAKDPRVQANAIIADGLFNLQVVELSEMMKSSNNRVAADAILVAGKIDFDRVLNSRLSAFLKSENPRLLASGLYVISTLVQYHAERDLVYLKANTYLANLAQQVQKFIDHQDEMVKNRARISQKIIDSVGVYAN